jgi:hypothetical protein
MWGNTPCGETDGMSLLSGVNGRHPGDARYEGQERFGQVVDFEKNAIVANADAPQVCAAGELGDARRSSVVLKAKKTLCHS